MTSILPFQATDLLKLNQINLDVLTENYQLLYYMQYLITWPTMFFKSANQHGRPTGYMLGKSEGPAKEFHSHISAVTVDADYRRVGIARLLVDVLELSSDDPSERCYFMDLFVRTTNRAAIDMYSKFGFHIFRRVIEYYWSGPGQKNQDAFDMRKPLKADPEHSSLKRSTTTFEEPQAKYSYKTKDLRWK